MLTFSISYFCKQILSEVSAPASSTASWRSCTAINSSESWAAPNHWLCTRCLPLATGLCVLDLPFFARAQWACSILQEAVVFCWDTPASRFKGRFLSFPQMTFQVYLFVLLSNFQEQTANCLRFFSKSNVFFLCGWDLGCELNPNPGAFLV